MTIMISYITPINVRQREILECVSNLADLLAANTNPTEINLQCLRIKRYAEDTLTMSYALLEHLRYLRREKKRRHRKNKRGHTEELKQYMVDYQSLLQQYASLAGLKL